VTSQNWYITWKNQSKIILTEVNQYNTLTEFQHAQTAKQLSAKLHSTSADSNQ